MTNEFGYVYDYQAQNPNWEEEQKGEFEALPEGEYTVIIDDAEHKPTKDETGRYLKVTFKVVSDKYKGRLVFVNYNVQNKSVEATKIGLGQLSSLMKACGEPKPENPQELKNRIVNVKLGIQPAKGDYKASNKITKYWPNDGTTVGGAEDIPFESGEKKKPSWA